MQFEELPLVGQRERRPARIPAGSWHGFRPLAAPPRARALDARRLACLEGRREADPVLDQIAREMEQTSVLETFQRWRVELHGSFDNSTPIFLKLSHLFDAGTTPEGIGGHHDGITFGLRTGDEPRWLAPHGNLMNALWGVTVDQEVPWVGKSFSRIEREELGRLTSGHERGDVPTYLGTNHFIAPRSTTSRFFSLVLRLWMGLHEAPPRERALYGHQRDGGLFIARRAHSVWPGTDREVLQLNYRWPLLGGRPPLSWLIDELVELSDGLYLGQLLFATRRVLERYAPDLAPDAYRYQHFGHFVLMDDRWAAETRRVFSNIGRGLVTEPAPNPRAHKFTTWTFAEPVEGNVDDRVLGEINGDLAERENILDLLRHYSQQLEGTTDARSPVFSKLLELFNRGIAPHEVRGYLRGALISFRSAGYEQMFAPNTLAAVWKLGRLLSPWTGKTFEDVDGERLRELTDGWETGEVPTFWGTNTVVFRTAGEKVTRFAMKAARIPIEDVSAEESQRNGYDAKTFFFIARKGRSINPDNRGRMVLQLNYRWPRLGTFPPDNYCIDEVVQIAEGLYLGQLTYATNLGRKYDPATDPSVYDYRVFGYFLLMDAEWQRLRLEMGFDPYNV